MANRPIAIDPIFSRKELPDSEDEVVRACDEMLDSYGGMLLAVPELSWLGRWLVMLVMFEIRVEK